jgi:hypothetical protein
MLDPAIAFSPHNPVNGREFYVRLEEKLEATPMYSDCIGRWQMNAQSVK